MKDGFVRVAVATPKLRVADCIYNAQQTIELMKQADAAKVRLAVFPELGLTAYTCGDLFLQGTLLAGAIRALEHIVKASQSLQVISVVGLPVIYQGKLYNCAAVVHSGKILGVVPKVHIPNYNEFYELRWFVRAPESNGIIDIAGSTCPFGTDILFQDENLVDFTFAIELCEDLWVPSPPSVRHAQAGATIMVNLSASDELVGKAFYKRQLVSNQSARLLCAYLYASAGSGESTTDMVFAGHDIIAENGVVLQESETPFEGMLFTEVDVQRLASERRRSNTFEILDDWTYDTVGFSTEIGETPLSRSFERFPFVPPEGPERAKRCNTIRMIQAMGLVKRLQHTHCERVVLGVSGGLDSTLALLVAVDAFDHLGLSREGIIAITMPCFGTTERTKNNARSLAQALGVTLSEIDITKAVLQHFEDIGQDRNTHDVTFENAQARERTQVLMDVANKESAFVIGTGDLSELALGWATYNGDHMSMYGVNASVPKTLIRYLVESHAQTAQSKELTDLLYDVLDTPVSPELLPAKEGKISQVTEDIVGPYELHDFFLYYALRWSFGPAKVLRLAVYAFLGMYDRETIRRWLNVFYRRFFSQQFKRSALPDGPKVGSVALSPRGDLRMPSDACVRLWVDELAGLE